MERTKKRRRKKIARPEDDLEDEELEMGGIDLGVDVEEEEVKEPKKKRRKKEEKTSKEKGPSSVMSEFAKIRAKRKKRTRKRHANVRKYQSIDKLDDVKKQRVMQNMSTEDKRGMEVYRRGVGKEKPYQISEVIALVERVKGKDKILEEAEDRGWKYDSNYNRKRYTCLIVDISRAIKDIEKKKKEIQVVDDISMGFMQKTIIPDLVHRVAAGANGTNIIQIVDVPTTVKKIKKNGKTIERTLREIAQERQTRIVPGNILFFSIQEKSSNEDIREGEFVLIKGLEYSDSMKGPYNFSMKASSIFKLYGQNLGMNHNKYLIQKLYSMSRIMGKKCINPTKEPEEDEFGKKIYTDDMMRNYVLITDGMRDALYPNEECDQLHVNFEPTIKRGQATRSEMKLLQIEGVMDEYQDSTFTKERTIDIDIAAFGKRTLHELQRLELFGINNRDSFDALLSYYTDNYDPDLPDEQRFTLPPMIITCKPQTSKPSLLEPPYGYLQFVKKEEDEEDDRKRAFKIYFVANGIVPDIATHLLDNGNGVPIKPVFAIMHLMNLNNMITAKCEDVMKEAEDQLQRVKNGVSFDMDYQGRNYINSTYNQMEPRRAGDFFNLTEFTGNVTPMFQHVFEGKAGLFLWIGGETSPTNKAVLKLRKDRRKKRVPRKIKNVEEIDEEVLEDMMRKESTEVSDNDARQIFIIYKEDVDVDL